MKNLYDYLFLKTNNCRDSSLKKTKEEKKKMDKKVFILCAVGVILIVAIMGMTVWIAHNDQKEQLEWYNETLEIRSEQYEDLLTEYKKLYDTNEWIEENEIRDADAWIQVGRILVHKSGGHAITEQLINNNQTQRTMIGKDWTNTTEMRVDLYDKNNDTWTMQWNCKGEECRFPILKDVEDDGTWYKWKGIWLRKDNNFAAAIQKIDDTIIQGIMRINDERELAIKLVTTNETDPYNEQWNCSGADCPNMTLSTTQ